MGVSKDERWVRHRLVAGTRSLEMDFEKEAGLPLVLVSRKPKVHINLRGKWGAAPRVLIGGDDSIFISLTFTDASR